MPAGDNITPERLPVTTLSLSVYLRHGLLAALGHRLQHRQQRLDLRQQLLEQQASWALGQGRLVVLAWQTQSVKYFLVPCYGPLNIRTATSLT